MRNILEDVFYAENNSDRGAVFQLKLCKVDINVFMLMVNRSKSPHQCFINSTKCERQKVLLTSPQWHPSGQSGDGDGDGEGSPRFSSMAPPVVRVIIL